MEEVLNNQQVRPGDATQFMHAIFSSDDEMMTFYLTFSRFVNPDSYLVQCTDRKRLEDLANVLRSNVVAFNAIHSYKSISVKEVIKGFGMYMMSIHISNANRQQGADAVGSLINCVIDTTKNSWQFRKMSRANYMHLENVRYLLNRLNTEIDEKEDGKAINL
ncbi:hypothetical protein [Bacteroides faecium]|uniref:CLU central domain-containing protein n=1 Tax=Bacteroides faecium TaxID=2715212 RepID=A0A6H0KJY6_9BACE|nr:hypothetical protein [Bacteroides faecium]QIU93712.1 hypothetical protein BacF7301_05915 [Bacteroides faecium]